MPKRTISGDRLLITNESYHDIGTLVLYEGGYIRADVAGLDWLDAIFEVSEDTNDFLKAYFE